jgi:hypothetical protein
MALTLEFEGFVNEIKQFDWGTVLKMSHSQRAKSEMTGQWETVGKDYLDVTVEDASNINEGDLLRVTGSLKVGTYDKRDGSTGVSLKVRATSVTPAERRQPAGDPVSNLVRGLGATPVEDAPF